MITETIRVIFTGICTFVGADVGNNNRPVTAVFPNASHHKPVHHVSLIVAEDDYDVETNLGAKLEYNELGKGFRTILLDGKMIALAGVTETQFELHKPSLSKRALKENRPFDVVEMESIRWIASLERSWPRFWPLRAARRMKRGFFSTVADHDLVTAGFELPNGTLASHWVSGDVWEFTPRSWTRRDYTTVIAQEVRFDTQVSTSTGTVHFDVTDLETRRHSGYIRITRRHQTGRTEPVEVVIANVPDEDRLPGSVAFCGECSTSECLNKNDPSPCNCVDHHYSHYYPALTSNMPERPSLPRRELSGIPLVPVALRVGGGNCSPAEYGLD